MTHRQRITLRALERKVRNTRPVGPILPRWFTADNVHMEAVTDPDLRTTLSPSTVATTLRRAADSGQIARRRHDRVTLYSTHR